MKIKKGDLLYRRASNRLNFLRVIAANKYCVIVNIGSEETYCNMELKYSELNDCFPTGSNRWINLTGKFR